MQHLEANEFWILRPDGTAEHSTHHGSIEADAPAWASRVYEALRASSRQSVELAGASGRLVAWRLAPVGQARESRTLVLRKRPPPWLVPGSLTGRQQEVCEYAASGVTVSEIAEQLRISCHTVRTHIKAAYRELGVSNRVELARALAVLGPGAAM